MLRILPAGKHLLFLCGLALLLSSCGTERTANCVRQNLPFRYVGFTKAELDTVIIYRYTAGSNFTGIADSTVLTTVQYPLADVNDTLYADRPEQYPTLTSGYDYIISVPHTGKKVRVTSITMEGQETMTYRQPYGSKVAMGICFNAVVSYQVDGVTYTPVEPEIHSPFVTVVR